MLGPAPLAIADDPDPQDRCIEIREYTNLGPCSSPPYPAGAQSWQRNTSWFDCDTGAPGGCGVGYPEDWLKYGNGDPGVPPQNGGCQVETPTLLVANTCVPVDEPDSCEVGGGPSTEASGGSTTTAGSTVELASGRVQTAPTDLDLGGALVFRRQYASTRSATGAMGKGWVHGLDWSAEVDTLTGGSTAVSVKPPFAPRVMYVKDASGIWHSGTRDAGAVTIDGTGKIFYTGGDGTKVRLSATGAVEEIARPGETPITVSTSGDTTTYSNGTQSLAITLYPTGHTNAGRVETVSGGGETWSYGYDAGQSLTTVTGPDLSTPSPSDTITWTYVYATYGSAKKLTRIDRLVGGVTTTIASWTWTAGLARVASADEPALEQPLWFSYADPSANRVQATVTDGASQTLAQVESVNRKLESMTQPVSGDPLGGPGFPAAVAAATSDGPRWRTKADKNGNVTLFDAYDASGNPTRVVEGWVDDGTVSGELDAGDHFATMRETVWHPRLRKPLSVVEPSVVTGALERGTVYDYDDPATPGDSPFAWNESPTDHVHARIDFGQGIDPTTGTASLIGMAVTYTLDAQGRITAEIGPRLENRTEHDYQPGTGYRTATRRYLNGAGSAYLETTYSNFDARGNPQTVTDPNGRQTLFTYDAAGRVKTVAPPYPGTGDPTITFSYDVDGNLTRVDFPLDSFSSPTFLRMGYDAKGRITYLADSQANAIVYEYTGGRATREAMYAGFVDLTSRGALKGDAHFLPDQAGRIIKAFNPLFQNGSVFTELDYDLNGNPTEITDENGREDVLVYDALDRLTQIQQLRAGTYTTGFDYDPASNVKQVTDAAGKETEYQYDDFGRLAQVISPDTGTTRYGYDAAGNLVTKREDATGSPRTTSYAYDGLDRLTLVDLPSDPDWVFSYDTSTALNQKGRLASVTNGVVTTEMEYTPRGELAKEATVLGGKRYAVAYGYDAAGNTTAVQTPSGTTTTYAFAGLRPKTVSVTAGIATETIRDLEFLPFGPRSRAEFPPFDAGTGENTVLSTRAYNARYQVTEIDVTGPMGTVLDRSYRYDYTTGSPGPNDPGPNLDRLVDGRDATESRFYFYDELDRLWKATDLSGNPLFTYTYDAVGNRLGETTPLGTTTSSYQTGTDRLAQRSGADPKHYAHDAFGSRIYAGPTPYSTIKSHVYDDSNRLVELRDPTTGALVASYVYDAFGRRVKKTWGTAESLFFYDASGHTIETVYLNPAADDLVKDAVFLEDELVGGVARWGDIGTVSEVVPLVGHRGIDRFLHGTAEAIPLRVLVVSASGLVLLALLPRRRRAKAATLAVALIVAGPNVDCDSTTPPQFYWVHGDHLGTPLAMTDTPAVPASAKVVWRAKYEPFGLATVDQDPDGDMVQVSNDYRFPGQIYDYESGLHYNYQRYFDPHSGRYLGPDALRQRSSIGLYGYAAANPLSFYDRTGLAAPYPGIGGGRGWVPRLIQGGKTAQPIVTSTAWRIIGAIGAVATTVLVPSELASDDGMSRFYPPEYRDPSVWEDLTRSCGDDCRPYYLDVQRWAFVVQSRWNEMFVDTHGIHPDYNHLPPYWDARRNLAYAIAAAEAAGCPVPDGYKDLVTLEPPEYTLEDVVHGRR